MSRLANSSELTELAAVADEVARARLAGLRPRLESTDTIDGTVLGGLVGAGLWSVGAPDSVGGQGGDLRTAMVVAQRLGRELPAVAVSLVHAHAAIAGLLALDDPDAATRCAAGEPMVVAFTSSNVDIPRVDLGLAPSRVLVATADTLTSRPAATLTRSAAHVRTGLHGLGTAPATAETLEPQGETSATEVVRWWTLGLAAVAVGAASSAVDQAAAYVGQRVQFGGPLTNQASIRATLDRLQGTVATAEAVLDGRLSSPADPTADEATARSVARTGVRVALDAIQLHGGYGYLREFPVEGLARDLVSIRAAVSLSFSNR